MTSKKIVVIDNFDSFTYNLVHLLEAEGARCIVMRNTHIDWSELSNCEGLLLGPGPGIPHEAGNLMQVIDQWHATKPILGICLGHQALGQYFGAQLINLERVYHGVDTMVHWQGASLLNKKIPDDMVVGLYHSWGIELDQSKRLQPICFSAEGVLMGMQHMDLPIYGLQFHPESIMTNFGRAILKNWLSSL